MHYNIILSYQTHIIKKSVLKEKLINDSLMRLMLRQKLMSDFVHQARLTTPQPPNNVNPASHL